MFWYIKALKNKFCGSCFKNFAELRKFHAKVARMTSNLTDLYKSFVNCIKL